MSLLPLRNSTVRISALALVILAGWGFISTAQAQIARGEVLSLGTQTLTTAEFLTGKTEGKSATISGELRIPRHGSDRLPAVILMHGAGGVGGTMEDWSEHLNSLGVATFVLDSCTGRGKAKSPTVAQIARIVDAYRALELLARHPRVDPDRIAVMGFSHGGAAALYSGMKRFARMYGPTDGLLFAAHIVFYPSCFTAWLERDDVTDRPIRIFHGEADDQIPIAPCREYATKLRGAGMNVVFTEYAGAYHSFDVRSLKEPVRDERAVSFVRCRLEEGPDGKILNSSTREPYTTSDPCRDRGRTLAYHAQAHNESIKVVTEFIVTTLKPK